MKERPILFSAPMVRAILAGTKTQTRRVVKPAHKAWIEMPVTHQLGEWDKRPLPYGKTGDRLWVREAFAIVPRTAYRCSEGVQQTLTAMPDMGQVNLQDLGIPGLPENMPEGMPDLNVQNAAVEAWRKETGVDDTVDDGAVSWDVITALTFSLDPRFHRRGEENLPEELAVDRSAAAEREQQPPRREAAEILQ